MEQIGRELHKIYRRPKRLPRRLRALVEPFLSSISSKGTYQKSKRFAVRGPTERSAHMATRSRTAAQMATDQISFYDESLKKQIDGSYVSDGKSIHVSSLYGYKSAPYSDLGACIDQNAQVLLAQKLLSELARDGGKDVHQPRDDQQLQPMQRPVLGASSGSWGGGVAGGAGNNP
jgi:hypothetical protein